MVSIIGFTKITLELSEPNTLKESEAVTPSKLPLTYTFNGVDFWRH